MATRISVPVDVHLITLCIESFRMVSRQVQVGRASRTQTERVRDVREVPPGEDRDSLTRAFGLANQIWLPADIQFTLRSSSVERVDAPRNREEIDEQGFFRSGQSVSGPGRRQPAGREQVSGRRARWAGGGGARGVHREGARASRPGKGSRTRTRPSAQSRAPHAIGRGRLQHDVPVAAGGRPAHPAADRPGADVEPHEANRPGTVSAFRLIPAQYRRSRRYLLSLGAPRKMSESRMKFWPDGSIMTWILSLSF